MTGRTIETLNSQTIAAVQELIEINIDSYNGFKQAAEQTEDTALHALFDELANERVGQAVALQKLIIRNDEQPISEGSIVGRIHRAIMDWRDSLGGGPVSVLKEVERGEDYLKAKYEAVLTKTAGSPVTDVLNHQYAAVQNARGRVRDLRDALTDV